MDSGAEQRAGRNEMSAAAQILSVEKLIAKWLSDGSELRVEVIDRERQGLDTEGARARIDDIDGIVAYLNDLLSALRMAVPEMPMAALLAEPISEADDTVLEVASAGKGRLASSDFRQALVAR